MIAVMISTFLASLGFGIVFNIKGKKLMLAGIGGAIGGVMYEFTLQQSNHVLMAMFFASVVFSLYSEVCARICKTPVTTFIICALIPLVPGGGMYRMMVKAIDGRVIEALTIGLDTLTIAGVLALGILLVSTIVKTIWDPYKKKFFRKEK